MKLTRHGVKTVGAEAHRLDREMVARVRAGDLAKLWPEGVDTAGCPLPLRPRQRAECERDLMRYLRTYHASTFYLPFSAAHKRVIAQLERSILEGGQFCNALPRGTGKTTLGEAAVAWALGYGHRQFVVVIGSTEVSARTVIRSLVRLFEDNDLLAEDFPELCIPFRELRGRPQRAAYQTCDGQRTHVAMKTERLVCATIPGAKCAGSLVLAFGLTGHLRGPRERLSDGRVIRPDWVWLDDPQTDESADSLTQTDMRERLIVGAVLGMAGPGKEIAALCACTVIRQGDLSDRLLDISRHPDWRGERASMVEQWPDAQDTLWRQYLELRADCQRAGKPLTAATEFYAEHRAAMDAGAAVMWPERTEGRLSALQYAEDLRADRGEHAFAAEYQNRPLESTPSVYRIEPDQVASALNTLRPGVVPLEAQHVMAFCDVNVEGLHWCVVAATGDLAGYVIAYGRHPPDRPLWSSDQPDPVAEQQAIYTGIADLLRELCAQEWVRSGANGPRVRTDRVLVDCGGIYQRTVFRAVGEHRDQPGRVVPARGMSSRYYRPPKKAIGHVGDQVHLTEWPQKGRVLVYNADFWRQLAQRGFLLPAGAPGSVSLHGPANARHGAFADQICAEVLKERIEGATFTAYNWQLTPSRANHWLDALVGCLACASWLGASPEGAVPRHKQRRTPVVSYAT